MSKGINTESQKSEVLQGTLDLMLLKVLDALGPQHGYGIARRIEQVSQQVLQLNEGTVYTSLLRLQQRKWIASEWGASENNRKAKYYSITKSGRKQLALETENWERIAGVIGRLLKLEGQGEGCSITCARWRRDFEDCAGTAKRIKSSTTRSRRTCVCSRSGMSARG